MTYWVVRVPKTAADTQTFLNEQETKGWTLVHVIPQFDTWDDVGVNNGLSPAKLVLHKP